jgi:hypothetical protein
MKRLGRQILNGLTVLSLVLCVGLVALWVWSYWRTPFARLLVAPPQKVKSATTAQAEAWARLQASEGWRARYSVRYVAGAASRGKLYLFLDDDREIDARGDWHPVWFRCAGDSSRLLILDDDPPIASSGIGDAMLWRRWGFGYYATCWG